MLRVRNIRKKAADKLRQKVNALSKEMLQWYRKYLNSENEMAFRLRDAETKQKDAETEFATLKYILDNVTEMWTYNFQVVIAENVRLRSMLVDETQAK
jgi:hypothetical protein